MSSIGGAGLTKLTEIADNTDDLELGVLGIKSGTDKIISSPATEQKQDDIITAIGGISVTSSYNYVKSETDATYKYYGFASSTGWQFKRKTLANAVWQIASGTGDFDTAWTDKANKTYVYAE